MDRGDSRIIKNSKILMPFEERAGENKVSIIK